jgi:hypothetical protein
MSSWMLRRVALVGTDVSEERSASFIRVTRIGELGTTLAVLLSPWCRRRYDPPKRRFLQDPHGITSQKTPFFRLIFCLYIYSLCYQTKRCLGTKYRREMCSTFRSNVLSLRGLMRFTECSIPPRNELMWQLTMMIPVVRLPPAVWWMALTCWSICDSWTSIMRSGRFGSADLWINVATSN